jgi:arylsulfatase
LTWPSRLDRLSSWLVPAFGVALLDVLVALWPAPSEYRFAPTMLRAVGLNLVVAVAALAAAGLALRPFSRRMAWPAAPAAGAAVTWVWLVLLFAAPSNRLLPADLCSADALVCGAHLARVLLPALSLAPVLALAAHAIATSGLAGPRGAILAALVPTLAIALAAEWHVVYGQHARGLRGTWPALGMFVLSASALLFAVARWRLERTAARLTAAAALLTVALTPAWLPLWAFARERAADRAAGAPDLVLLVTVDALRADAVSYDAAGHTPNLARLARESVVFTRAASPSSWTLPTFGSWMTGLSPATHLIDASGRLPAAVTTLPELLRRGGYTTAAVVDNPLFAPPSELAARFDQTFPLTANWYDASPRMTMSVGPRVWASLRRFGAASGGAGAVTSLAASWLRAVPTGKVFLWVHYLDPHGPYTPSAAAAGRAAAAAAPVEHEAHKAYLGEVAQADEGIGRLLDGVRASGRYDGALIIVTSDHGEELGAPGETGHGRTLRGEVVDVPFIVKLPGAGGGRAEPARVSTQSLFATVLDACGIPYDAGGIEAPSLLGVVRGHPGERPPEPSSWLVRFYRGSGRPQAALFLGDFKYVRLFEPDAEQLFDLRADPGERESVAAEHPDIVAHARQRLARERERASALRRTLRITDLELQALDPDRIKALRSLGYIQ